MIISVEKLKEFITTDVPDTVLEVRLQALETSIRYKTHNNFQDRRYRTFGDVSENNIIVKDSSFFEVDDTIMIDKDICVIEDINDKIITINKSLLSSTNCIITKVVYPQDIVLGVVDVMSWVLANPSQKAGISSETLSRHSVTYQNNTEFDNDIGCPSRLLSFLNQYKKARF